MYAMVESGLVKELASKVPDVHPDLKKLYLPVPSAVVDAIKVGWTSDGSNFEAPVAPPAPVALVPDITSAQAKIQLSRTGFLPAVKASVEAIGGEVEIWFTDARIWQRNNSHVVEIGTGLNLSSAEIDDLFREASQISA